MKILSFHPEASENSATHYSLFATCKFHNVYAYEWLKYVSTACLRSRQVALKTAATELVSGVC